MSEQTPEQTPEVNENKPKEVLPSCKSSSSVLVSPGKAINTGIEYWLVTLFLSLSVGFLLFVTKSSWLSSLPFLTNDIVKFIVFTLLISLVGGVIGMVNSRVYDSVMMGVGLFIGMSLLSGKSPVNQALSGVLVPTA